MAPGHLYVPSPRGSCIFTPTMTSSTHGREVLPTNVKPTKYELTIEPEFSDFTFSGSETIELKVQEESSTITLNSLEIEIHSASVDGVDVKSISYDKEKQTATFELPSVLKKDTVAHLSLTFSGILNDKMAGFYRSSYTDDAGTTKYLATTQFEPTDCRQAFPSFDEPALKAQFAISLVSDSKFVHLSNMDEKEVVELENGKKKTVFNTTPLMSTYLVAFIVGDLKYVENTSYKVPIKTWATPGHEHLGQYAADIAAKTLAFFDKEFDIPYPLPKMDMVAIHDFSAGAMENFGLVTYRTVALLLDPENTDVATKHRVTEVVTHELAHQWFGNLVTMDFWDGLWLNEGFATWMSWYATNELFPEWKVWESYVADSLQQALKLDSLRSSHPVEVPVKRADEINQIFDAISYSKGSSLLKMISRWLGEKTFVKGVSQYLKQHKWGNTQTSDLWKALSDASGENVVEVMDIWTKNIGYPVVSVEENGLKLTFTQHRFLATGDVKPEEDKVIYPVFLAFKTSAGIDDSVVLNGRTTTLDLEVKDDFFKVNGDQSGIYLTAYSEERWAKLGKAAVDGKLSVEDRIGLVSDATSLATSGYISTVSLLNLIRSWENEENYVVWTSALTTIGNLKTLFNFADESVKKSLSKFALELIAKKLGEIGHTFNGSESYAEQQLKLLLFGVAAANGHEEVNKYAAESFEKYVAGDYKAIHPNLRSSIFTSVAKTGDEATFETFLSLYKKPQSAEEKNDLLRAFGRFENEAVLDKILSLILNPDVIKPQDIYLPMVGMRSHKTGVLKLWKWVTENWDAVYKVLPPGLSMLGLVVGCATSGFTNLEQKAEIEKFFGQKDTKGYDQSLAQSLDSITAKANWATRDGDKITQWLATNGYSAKL